MGSGRRADCGCYGRLPFDIAQDHFLEMLPKQSLICSFITNVWNIFAFALFGLDAASLAKLDDSLRIVRGLK